MAAIFIILSSFAGICVALMDRISHYDNVGKGFWSRDYYHNAKYYFMKKHPRVPKWFVMSFLVMFLDAWHFLKLINLLCLFGLIALFSFNWAVLGFALYQIYFTIFYSK
jgi:hypothetical protein